MAFAPATDPRPVQRGDHDVGEQYGTERSGLAREHS
jgi:hypothetical protein